MPRTLVSWKYAREQSECTRAKSCLAFDKEARHARDARKLQRDHELIGRPREMLVHIAGSVGVENGTAPG